MQTAVNPLVVSQNVSSHTDIFCKDDQTKARGGKSQESGPFHRAQGRSRQSNVRALPPTHCLQQSLVLLIIGSVAQNASCAPLSRMPLEMSHKIWALVLGHRLIHMKYDERRQSWGHIICEHDCPESEMGKIFSDIAEDGERRIICQGRHHRCDDELANYKHSGDESLHLTPLRVCRQKYHEANYVL